MTPLALNANGIPHLLRGGDSVPAMPAATATESARQHLTRLAPAWGLRSAAKMPVLEALGEVPVKGGTIVRFRQVIDGLPVEPTAGGEMHVMVRGDGSLVGASGAMRSTETPRQVAAKFVDADDAAAVTRAVNGKYKTSFSPDRIARARTASNGARVLGGQADAINVSMSRAHQAWYPQGKALVPAWIVEAYSSNNSTDGDAYRTVIAADGKILAQINLKSDAAFKYRVYAEDTGEFHPFDGPELDSSPNTATPMFAPNGRVFPDYRPANLVTVDGTNHPAGGSPDPWLPTGAVQSKGNNVDAYTDATPPDGFSNGDFRADPTAAGVFDRTYDFTKSAIATDDQQKTGITSLFYLINWMHDFWYDGGFVEAAGNGQASNLGRGGVEGDPILAEAQDNARGPNGGSRDNANMATPSDGMSGKMQVFVWDNEDHRTLTANAIGRATGTAAFGPTTYSATGTLSLAVDGTAPTGDACQALTNDVTGKVVIVDRGACSFKTKTLNAQTAGAVAVIMANNAPGTAPGMADDATITTAITIPTLSVSQADGVAIKAQGAIAATLSRNPGPDLDGTLDITVIGHEFGHFVHHRLSVCDTQLCGAMSEGWADFSALLVSSRAGDNFDAQYPLGIFSTRGSSPDPVYYGIRRAPYTTNHAVNGLMFHHMSAGATLPTAPFNGGDPAGNSEVHNAGEVWASMLWEGYAALQKAGGADQASFEATRLKMRQYVVAGLMMAPPNATPTETRDAILMAAKAASPADHDLLVAAYGQRGFGSCAISPDRDSQDFTGITDSADIKGQIGVTALDVTRTSSCDNDQVLDPGEVMQIVVPVTNTGPVKMTGVQATLHSSLVTVDGDQTVMIGDLEAGAQASATFSVSLNDSVTQPTESDITIELASIDGCTLDPIPLVARFDADDLLASSATDDFNADASPWTTNDTWQHIHPLGLEGLQFGADLATASDNSLTSPPMIAGTGPVTISFQHEFAFEISGKGTPAQKAFDGGVIEYSIDAGATWQDISGLADPGYNVTLDGTTDTTDNVLAGRMAYGGENKSAPDGPDTVTLALGTQLSGKTFQIRFRLGTDSGNGSGASGWAIDNFAATGLTNTPFPTVVADADHCAPAEGTHNSDGGCCQTGSGFATGNLAAALGVLGLVLRRRRRRVAS